MSDSTTPKSQADIDLEREVATATSYMLDHVSNTLGMKRWEISRDKTKEVAYYLLRDIDRLSDQQGPKVSETKFASYWAFWVRKVKPIRVAYRMTTENGVEVEKECTDVNERAAIEIAISFLTGQLPDYQNRVTGKCGNCDGGQCFNRFAATYFKVRQKHYYEYLVYSLGKRTFGPHHLSAVFDALIFSSCRANTPA